MEYFVLAAIIIICLVCFYKNQNSDKQLTEDEKYKQQLNVKASVIGKNELPLSVTSQLLADEKVYYFSFLVLKNEGGCCGSSSREDYWITLTDKRILYKTKIREDNNVKLTERNGVIPFDKISGIEIISKSENLGCAGDSQYYELQIGSMGQLIKIPLPTEEKGFEIRKIYTEVLEIIRTQNNGENDK